MGDCVAAEYFLVGGTIYFMQLENSKNREL